MKNVLLCQLKRNLPNLRYSALLAGSLAFAPQLFAQLPAILPVNARVVITVPPAFPTTTISKIARDAAGNLFVLDGGKPQIYELPVSGPVQLIVPSTDPAMMGQANAVVFAVDPAGNIYVGKRYSGGITQIPRNSNGTYNLAGEAPFAVGLSGITNNYYQPSDLAVDAIGNVYVAAAGGNTVGNYTGKGVLIYGPSAPSGKYLAGANGAPANTPATIAVDTLGNVFYTDGANVNEVTAASVASATPVSNPIGYNGTGTCPGCATITAPNGVFLDQLGNVYTQSASGNVLVIANSVNGFSTSSLTYLVGNNTISGHSQTNQAGAIDNEGNFVAGFGNSIEKYGGGTLYLAPSSNFYGTGGTLASNTSASGTTTKTPSISYLFTVPTTLNATTPIGIVNAGSVNGGPAAAQVVLASGSTCTAGTTFTAGQSCTVTVGYSAKQPGPLVGAVVLYGTAGNVLNVTTVQSLVTGSALTVDPGVQTTIGTGYTAPSGVAVDGAGNTYVADQGSNSVLMYARGSTVAGTALGTGLSAPSGVALDAAGNVYIADTGNNRVVIIPVTLTGFGTQTTLATTGFTLNSPRGIATDTFGYVYIADTGNARVLQLPNPFAGTMSGPPVSIGSGFVAPYGIAVDLLNNIFVADRGANNVVEIAGGFTLTNSATVGVGPTAQTTVGTGLNAPTGVAVDGAGSVYIADGGNSRVVRVPNENGVLTAADQVTLSTGYNRVFGIATDLTNDLYITDSAAPKLAFVQRSAASGGTAATVAFGSVAAAGSVNKTISVGNAGYQTALAISAIAAPAAPFTRGTAAAADCGTTATLVYGNSCNLLYTFTAPATTGNSTGSSTLTDNALGIAASTQMIALTGVASGPAVSASLTGNATTVYGTPDSFTLTAKDASGNPSAAANGTYTVNITGTAASSASVTLNGGTGSFFLPALGVGSYNLSTTVSGFNATATVTVTKAPLTLTPASFSRAFDTPNPTLIYSYVGLVNGDSASVVTGMPTITTTATRTSPAGTYPITASAAGLSAANYTITAGNGTLTITGSAPQIVLFAKLPNLASGSSYTLTALSTSGLPVVFSVVSGSATISGTTLTVNAAGAVVIQAAQTGNVSYAAAAAVSRSFTAQ